MPEQPASRRLRIFAFDPSVATSLETATIDELMPEVPWEELGPGTIGEYLEVIDVDPASGVCYEPVNLNDVRWLARDGLRPSESNPRFTRRWYMAAPCGRSATSSVAWDGWPCGPIIASGLRANTASSSSAGCEPTPTPSGIGTPTTARPRMRCC